MSHKQEGVRLFCETLGFEQWTIEHAFRLDAQWKVLIKQRRIVMKAKRRQPMSLYSY